MIRLVGLPLEAWCFAAIVGLLLGAAWTLSPTTVCFVIVLPPLFAWAGRGLGPRERHWVVGLLGLAVAARVVALSGFFLTANPSKEAFAVLFGDERFLTRRSLWALQAALGHRLAPDDYLGLFADYGRSGTQYLFAFWQLWVGPAPYGLHLISIVMWVSGVIVVHRMVRRGYGPLAALGAFAALLFMPTLFAWSISALKEPAYFLLTALTLAGTINVVSAGHARQRASSLILVVTAVAAISTLRSIALAATAGGLVLAAAGWLATRRAWVGVAMVVLLVAGATHVVREPAAQARLMREFRMAAISHLGNVNTSGYGYRLLDPHFYSRNKDNSLSYMVPAEAARFALRAAVSFFLVPLPWEVASRPALALVPQQLAWYALAALAWVGAVAGWRRDGVLTWVLVGNALVGGAAVALYNGNVGTLVRLRDSIVPVVVLLSALGGCAVMEWFVRVFSNGASHRRHR